MQQGGFLTVVLLVVGFCSIAAGQFKPFYESTAARGSVTNIDIHTALRPTSAIPEFHMPNYEQLFERCQPEAIQLRERGLTPQETCTKLAHDIFRDKNKYNTVKGWYQRTFDDWPSEGSKAKPKKQRRLQNGISNQQRVDHPLGLSLAYLPPQQRQSFPQHEQDYTSQQISSTNSYHRSFDAQYQAMEQDLPLNDNVSTQSARQTFDYAPSHHYPQSGFAGSYIMRQPGDHQDLSRGLNLQMSPRQYSSLPQQRGARHKSAGNALQSIVEVIIPSHPQNYPQFQQNGCSQQATTYSNEGGNLGIYDVIQEPNGSSDCGMNATDLTADKIQMTFQQFLYSDSLDPNHLESIGSSGEGLNLSLDGQRFDPQSNAAPKQPVSEHIDQRYPLFQTSDHQSTSLVAGDSFPFGPGYAQIHASPSHQDPSNALTAQHEPARASNKHYRSSSMLSDPTPPPQYPLPPDPPAEFRVIRKQPNVEWRPVRVKEGSMVTVDPNRLPTDHPPKRVKGLATKSHDSMVIHQEHLKAPHLAAPGTSASDTEQAAAARVPLRLRPADSSNTSVHSSLRDSGYISLVDSTIQESLQSAFSNLELTDAECKTDYKEADDGFVDVEITTKGRMRRSYIEKMHSPIF